MSNALQVDFLLAGVLDSSGNSLDSGLVYTYEAGTTTAKTTYTAADKSANATNPIVLDSYGKATIYADGNYKFIIKTSAGVTVATLDNLYYAVPGTEAETVTSITTTYTTTTSDDIIKCNTASGNITLNLIAATGNEGVKHTIYKSSSDANTVTVTPDGSETIDGQASYTISQQYDGITIASDGANWQVITKGEQSPLVLTGAQTLTTKTLTSPTITTPTVTGGTLTSSVIKSPTIYQDTGTSYLQTLKAASGTLAHEIIGAITAYGGRSAPTGWLLCNGAAVSRTTYLNLFNVIVPSLSTVTVTIASPGVFTITGHGLVAGDAVYFTTTGALPTGLSANTLYYVISAGLTADEFEVSTSVGGAAVNTSGSQNGTHTARHCPWGLGDGSTTFNVPYFNGRTLVGAGAAGAGGGASGTGKPTGGSALTAIPAGGWKGAETHVLLEAELATHTHAVTDPGHDHTVQDQTLGGGSTAYQTPTGTTMSTQQAGAVTSEDTTGITIGNTGSNTAHNNLQPLIGVHYIIKY